MTVAQAASDLGLPDNILRSWGKGHRDVRANVFPGYWQQFSEQVERAALKRMFKELKVERDILQKSSSLTGSTQKLGQASI